MWEMGAWGHGYFWIIPLIFMAFMFFMMFTRRGGMGGCMGMMGGHGHDSPSDTESLEDIVKRRYASGEIDKEEFERLKKDLGG